MTNETKLTNYQNEINVALEKAIPEKNCLYGRIFEAMRYSLNAGGKRLRPVLLLEFARVFGVEARDAMPFALALEMIHTYSLIHDDLPCMDDDDLRRGRPTNHKVFGEATAVLAGDGLLNFAFEYVLSSKHTLSAETVLEALSYLAKASGSEGMIGGQIIDMEGEERALSEEEIKTLQSLKTGALIRAATYIGARLGNADAEMLKKAEEYADCIGLAFQIQDDILNVEGDPDVIGKDVGNDEKSGKSTFVKLLGLNKCKERVGQLTEKAVEILGEFPDSDFLKWLTSELASRKM